MLRIRLRRTGKRGQASYRVVVADQRSPRDGAFLENLGAYYPHKDPPLAELNTDRAREWLDKGAQPSEAAEKILRRLGVIEGPAPERKYSSKPKKSSDGDDATSDDAAAGDAAAEASADDSSDASEPEGEAVAAAEGAEE